MGLKAKQKRRKTAKKAEKVEEPTAVWRKRMSSGSVVSGGEVDDEKAKKAKKVAKAGRRVGEECKLRQDEE